MSRREKRTTWLLVSLIFPLFAMAALTSLLVSGTGCGDGKSSTASSSGRYKIGFANIAEDFPFAVRTREGIERAAKEAGNVDLALANNRMDGQTALNNADTFLVQGVKGVIEFQTDEQFGRAIMDKFTAEKIPVIAIDIPMKGAVFFGVNNTLAGRMAGEGLGKWIKKNWDGKVDALIMLELPQSGPIPAERMKGQRDGLESVVGKIDESNVKHLDSKNTLEEAHRLVKDVLNTLPNAHHIAIVCINDDTALGAIGAAEAGGRTKDIAVVAVDGSDRGRAEIRKHDSPMVGTTASFPEKYGDKIIPLMLKMMKGEKVPDAVYTDHAFLTRDTIAQYYPQSMNSDSTPPLLEMRQIRKSFSGTEVLHGVDLTLDSGEVLALLGENGAGKSTLIKILNGDYSKDAGQILLDGHAVDFRTPRDAQRAGIRVIYQELNDAPDLSATENVLLGQLPRRSTMFPASLMVDWPQARNRTAEVLSALNADFPPERKIRHLSVGQRQIVEIARALSASTTRARLLVMDEPTAALTPREVDVLFETIASLRRQGVGIIYISHRLDEVQRIAQRVMVMRDGNVAGVVSATEVSSRDIVRMMVGRDIEQDSHRATQENSPDSSTIVPAIELSHLSRSGAFDDVSFSVRPGESVGLFGLLGAGHLAITRAIFGAESADSGEIRVDGSPIHIDSPRKAMRHGVGLLAEDRKSEGLVPAMSVADNLMLSHWPAVASGGVISLRRQSQRAREWVAHLGVRLKSGVRQPIATLSGGNQQKVLLARWLEAGVKILLLNEPTRGVDVGARADIYALLDDLRRKGLAVVVCSSDLEEVLEVSDRVLVFAKGKLVAHFDRQQANRESLLAAAAL